MSGDWAKKNPEKHREASDRWRKANPDKIKEANKKRRESHPEEQQKYTRKYQIKQRVNNTEKYLWEKAKQRATRSGIEFSISVDDIYIPEYCPVLGIKLSLDDGDRETSPSLDRIDNRYGYIRGNIEVISYRANRLKSNASPDELMRIAMYYND